MVCMAIEGAQQIEGGNWQIFDGMVKASNASLLLNSTVNEITKQKDKYMVNTSSKHTDSGETTTSEEPFDTVVLAAPLQYSGLDISSLTKHVPDKIPYVTLHVTLFSSPKKFDAAFFNLTPDAEVPTTILTTLPANNNITNPEDAVGPAGFFSISTLRTVINPKTLEKEHLYKIFSPKKITTEFLSGLLGVPSTYIQPPPSQESRSLPPP
jgi:prenylcysteine oxidase/farnesylcysteine lyase